MCYIAHMKKLDKIFLLILILSVLIVLGGRFITMNKVKHVKPNEIRKFTIPKY